MANKPHCRLRRVVILSIFFFQHVSPFSGGFFLSHFSLNELPKRAQIFSADLF